jgi:hypothetical protein
VESWRRLVKDFPLVRESAHTWFLSCPPLLESKEQERESPKGCEKEIWDEDKSKATVVFIAMEHRNATVTCVLLTPAHPLECVASRIVHHAPVIQTVKKMIQLFKERCTEDVIVMQ